MRGTQGWVQGSMALPRQLYAATRFKRSGEVKLGCAVVASGSWALQQASSSRQQGLVDAKGLVTGRVELSLLF